MTPPLTDKFRPFLLLAFALWFCGSTNPELVAESPKPASTSTTPEQIEFFEKKIRPLFAKHCLECHATESAAENGELDLESIAGIAQGGSRGPLWDDEHSEKSLLLEVLRYADPDLQMPPEGKLKPAELDLVAKWIEQGAPLPAYKSVPRREKSGIDYAEARKFWSFRPLAETALPEVKEESWVEKPFDRFILARLEQEQLSPRARADRRVLIRRLSFDLIGLPPTPDQVAQFLADESPEAYEQLVDRLLASPHYGERWGRVWLDLARYTDVTASWLKQTGQAWLYRDWVVQAFNDNLPYDRFVQLQLAGDLLPETTPDDLAALGFLGLSPTYWKEMKLAPDVIKQVVADEWDERIDAVSRTFLGLTISCARCHDHKFDPISAHDYYALAGVFASTQLHDQPRLPETEAQVVRTAHEQVEKLTAQLKAIADKKSPEAAALKEQIAEIKTATPNYDEPWLHTIREASIYVKPDGTDATRLEYQEQQPRDLPMFRRGNPANTGEIVPRGFPVLFSSSDQPRAFSEGSGRQELADAIFADAPELAARVFVNRIWLEHFGRGLVRTPSNFGIQGERPTHPELLEWLASEFIRRNWDIKWLQREIVCSATYRQSSEHDAAAHQRDPDNQLYWRMNRRRLTIEMWRDAMLSAAGTLDLSVGGAPLPLDDPKHHRRTIYGKVARRDLDGMLKLYDFPEPTSHSPARVPTTTPLQQLFVLNAPFVERRAEELHKSLPAEAALTEQIQLVYRRLFAREATTAELALGRDYLNPDKSAEVVSPARWQSYLHALLGLNEFLYID